MPPRTPCARKLMPTLLPKTKAMHQKKKHSFAHLSFDVNAVMADYKPTTPNTAAIEEHSLCSENDPVNGLYVILEMLQVIENELLTFACWMMILHPGCRISSFKMNPFNVIHLFRRAVKKSLFAVHSSSIHR